MCALLAWLRMVIRVAHNIMHSYAAAACLNAYDHDVLADIACREMIYWRRNVYLIC